jgi:two-component system, NarL family, sensor histidine kinase DesK
MAEHQPTLAGTFAARAVEACDDPDAAPGAFKGDPAAPPWTFRRGVQNMFWIYASGLAFLIFAVVAAVADPASPSAVIIQLILITLIAVGYLLSAWISDMRLAVRWTYIVGFVGLTALTAPYWGWSFINYGVYVSVMLATLIPWRQARVAIPVWSLLVGLVAVLAASLTPVYIALIGGAVGLATGAGIQAGRIGARLHRAEQRVSALALAAERERIGRDLHDILGHSLTAISIKANLAERLLDVDPQAARAQIAEVSEIARQSLADVRATASAIREVRVAGEIASARSVLLAAGIEASVPSALEPMPDSTSELFGYVIREAVTNVVRHSEASHCTISIESAVDHQAVTVTDDGSGLPDDLRRGTGLQGLRSRLEAAGGTFTIGPGPTGGTQVRASLPTAPVATRAGDVDVLRR